MTGDQGAVAEDDGAGQASAQPLSPTANWDVATHTGDFTWTYPMRVPPAPGGLVPELGLTYRSSAVDGRTSATNNQPSWVGEGWDLAPGFVERTYGACADDTAGGTTPPKNGDLCWRSDNATAVFPGGGGMLVRDDGTGTWKSRADDGARVERKSGAGNGDDDGEHWVITTVDGTQYWFGSTPDAKSTWTVPVFGDDAGEPCHKAAFDAAHCTQAWRWNLDKVVDRNGNVIRYFYAPETNRYGMNLKDTAVSYTRGGTLERIEYGLRADVATPAARVLFAHAGRCVPGSGCLTTQHDNWPDVAWKAHCDTDLCADKHTPTFWTTRRLASVTTEVRRGSDFTPVDRWTFEHAFPNPGDGEKAALWLKAIKHSGLVGGTAELPSITFEGTALPNRVDTQADGIAPLNRYRLTAVVSEAGGVTEVRYASECRPGGPQPAAAHENTLRCFPVRWAKRNFEERTDHFHKYVVESVLEYDRTASSRAKQTRYEYLGGAAWHWDTGEFAADDEKSWTEFRGFGRVRVRVGAADDQAGPVTMTEERYHRGMDGDRLPTGKRAVSVADSEGGSRVDADWLAGFRFETATFEREAASDQPDPVRVGKTLTDPAVHGPTATRGEYKAYIVRTGTTRTFTPVEGGVRKTASTTLYDEHGLPYRTDDQGDTATAADDLCTTTTYHRDTGKWLMALPATTRTVSVHCGETAVFPTHAVSATRTTYDDFGNATKTEVGDTWTGADPVYAVTATMGYDAHGRPTSVTDALGKTTTTDYTPAHGGPLTATTVTTPPTPAVQAGLVTTTTIDPAWGVPTLTVDPNGRTTEVRHDPLGRRVKVWLPNRRSAEHPTPSVETTYQVRKDDLSAVTTTRVGPNGTGITSTALHDGLLRHRQTQSPAFDGGRLLTDTRYDSHGRPWKTTQPYFAEGPVDTKLWTAADTAIPGHTRTLHDGAGRRVASVYFAGAFEKWRTTTAHGGDRVHVTPPAGGTATTTITDARGRVVELRQHRSATDFDTTRYTYTPTGNLETLTDPADAVWRYEYDLRGRRTKADDPDSGVTTTAYDAASRIAKVTDARGSAVTYGYDSLGRRTTASKGTAKFAEWTYDTATKGKGRLATTTRWTAGRAYKTGVSGYTALYLPLSRSVTIPAEEGLLAGTYETFYGYEPDGSLSAESYPAAGELPEESVNYDYHDTGQPNTSTGGYNGETHRHVAGTTYTRYGELERVEMGSGTKRAWLTHYYDANTRRLKRTVVDAELPSPKLSDTTYTRDDAGNITAIADGADVQCFRHDPLGRVTEAYTADCSSDPAVASLAGPASYWHSYTYDKSGNRKTETHHAASGDIVRTYAYGVPGHAHAVGSVTTQGPGGTTSASYAYLASGQTATRPGQSLTWDTEGRLASVVEGTKTTSFVYDADGNRLMRKEPGATTLYLGNQELRLGASGTPSVTRYYSSGGRVVALRRGLGALTWLASDHQSTAQLAIASDTQEVTRRRHLPFGAPGAPTPPGPPTTASSAAPGTRRA
ncbi:type IV secretion protein Rhs [Actinokineospora soli]|uniref:Type IV secretion protein Rhs n=1 Tax=Actinokineospora soli TaxID=1048753 RepID=A0ABW2TTN1_9PSEU